MAGSNSREIIVTALTEFDFDAFFDYRIKPVRTGAGMLKCVGVGNGLIPVADYGYVLFGQ